MVAYKYSPYTITEPDKFEYIYCFEPSLLFRVGGTEVVFRVFSQFLFFSYFPTCLVDQEANTMTMKGDF